MLKLKFRLWRKTNKALFASLLAGAVILVTAGTVLGVTYVLNQDVPGTVTITSPPAPPPPPEAAVLYVDEACTTPVSGTLAFGTIQTGGAGVVKTLYYKTSEIPGTVTTTITGGDPAKATITATAASGVVTITVTPIAATDGELAFTVNVKSD